jgi:hypothetical protein
MTHRAHPISNPPPHRRIVWAQRADRALAQPALAWWAKSGPCAAAYALGVFASSLPAFTVLVARPSVTVAPAMLVFAAPVWIAFVYLARWMTWVDRSLVGRATDASAACSPTEAKDQVESGEAPTAEPALRSCIAGR